MNERRDGVAHPWARHYQHGWSEVAGDARLPAWLRVAALAYGHHHANGHATFGPGHVAGLVLATVDPSTGELIPMQRAHAARAVATAVRYGWLAEGSTLRCMIVPAHRITGGLGDANEPCPQHQKQRRRRVQRPDLKVVGE